MGRRRPRHAYQPGAGALEAAQEFPAGEWDAALILHRAPVLVWVGRAAGEFPVRRDDPRGFRPKITPATFAGMREDYLRMDAVEDPIRATVDKCRRWLATAGAAPDVKVRGAPSDCKAGLRRRIIFS
jgi:hypothetical protein